MIHHVTRRIRPPQLESCIAFYRLLGFESVPPPPGIAGRAVWLDRDGYQIHLMPSPDAVAEQGHVGIVAAQYDATLQALSEHGHEVEPRRPHWGSPRSYVRDPAGNLVELMAWPPGRSPDGGRE